MSVKSNMSKPKSGPAEQDRDTLQEVVAKAYAAIGEPQSFVPLLNDFIDAHETLGGIDGLADVHFENAEAIFDKVYPLGDADYSSMLLHLEADLECDLALDEQFRVLTFNSRFFENGGLKREKFAPEWLFDPARIKDDQARLRKSGKGRERVFIRLFTHEDDDTGRWFSAYRIPVGGEHIIALQAVRLRWDESSAAAFHKAFDLTATELELTKHLVKGGTMREFAEMRQRSVGTVRNQMKALQRKLVINSKEQLLLLYAGFIHSLDPPVEDAMCIAHTCANLFCDTAGRTIAWEEYGDPAGLPVLLFHALEGPLLTPGVDQAASAAGLRIIGPWRPHYGATSGIGPGPQSPLEFADRLPEFLDHLGIERCVALGTQAGTPFLAAFVQRQSDRILKGVAAGPFLPIVNSDDYQFLQTRQRVHFRIARVAPAFARVYMRAMLASMGTGEFYKFVEDYYDGCSREADTVQRPEVVRNFRRAANYVLPRGKLGPGDTMANWSAQWGELLDGTGPRLEILIGEQDSNTPLRFAQLTAKRFGLEPPQTIPDASSFLIEEKPDLVFSRIRTIFEAG